MNPMIAIGELDSVRAWNESKTAIGELDNVRAILIKYIGLLCMYVDVQ